MHVLPICIKLQFSFSQKKRGKRNMKNLSKKMRKIIMKKEPGIDGILVTVGLCIIALLLCVVMKDSMATFIQTIVNTLTSEAQKILTGVTAGTIV